MFAYLDSLEIPKKRAEIAKNINPAFQLNIKAIKEIIKFECEDCGKEYTFLEEIKFCSKCGKKLEVKNGF